MRPVAAVVVAAVAGTPVTPNQLTLLNLGVFVVAAAMFAAMPSFLGGLFAVAVLEVSAYFDCADGMLARFQKLASKTGHLFHFFTDELKAVLLAAALAVRAFSQGRPRMGRRLLGRGIRGFSSGASSGWSWSRRPFHSPTSSRRRKMSRAGATVEAFYEASGESRAQSPPPGPPPSRRCFSAGLTTSGSGRLRVASTRTCGSTSRSTPSTSLAVGSACSFALRTKLVQLR